LERLPNSVIESLSKLVPNLRCIDEVIAEASKYVSTFSTSNAHVNFGS
jgi:hypothetical protein